VPPQHAIASVTRLAPSPTGALHLGNARTFVVNWILARRLGWRIVLRIEDLDGPRTKPEAIGQTLRTLAWLGLDWDIGPIRQSEDTHRHADALARLAARALAYPCALTRAQVAQAASAPHAGRGRGEAFAGATRPASLEPRAFEDRLTNWRFVMPIGAVTVRDAFAGKRAIDPLAELGDVVVWTRRGQAAYHLAVVVDDAAQGVDQVVRGDDLLTSAACHLRLYEALGLAPTPRYTHLPLVVGPDGRRLAKRHGDSRLEHYRAHGVPVERIIGLLACWTLPDQPTRQAMDLHELADRLDLDTIPRGQARFTPEDDAWLLGR